MVHGTVQVQVHGIVVVVSVVPKLPKPNSDSTVEVDDDSIVMGLFDSFTVRSTGSASDRAVPDM